MTFDAACGERRCYVHVGTHKTGTTAIQHVLAANAEALARAGIAYPQAGRIGAEVPGHHHLPAEQLWQRAVSIGALDDLAAEVLALQPQHVVLSSEAFEYLHVRPDLLVVLRDTIEALGYRPLIVVYVRSQSDYVESLYAQMVHEDIGASFDDFLHRMLRDGCITALDGATYRFEYSKLVDAFAAVFGADAVSVRGYVKGRPAQALIDDFLATVNVPPHLVASMQTQVVAFENPRRTVGQVIVRLYGNMADRFGDDLFKRVADEFLERFPDEANRPFRPLSVADRRRIAARFASDNAQLAARWHLEPATFAEPPEPASDPDAGARRLFAAAEARRIELVAGRQPRAEATA